MNEVGVFLVSVLGLRDPGRETKADLTTGPSDPGGYVEVSSSRMG